ncbi:sarcosine oxidase subunit gamma [Pseudooctadecabacter jejudonensis]|uniref:Sarcosine oxidase, gamma subunit family n=1 Tax=Pseudooctadecabacter jejudonensis TaxID=1391910 RepID=A0A1Y5RH87_9RHOB|nr:sarcosine oxidase subunit gamma family protein [Pseudooctadecabacter jejudonensis]SLN17327.1 Sarcosine oxidase, gamma subunit family [Pseudooctadecabacter jejudonensis]
MSDLAKVIRHSARGMITLRGDLTSSPLKKAVKAATGYTVPKAGHIAGDDTKGVIWMSPDELLVMVPYGEVEATLAALDKTLLGKHYLAVDVSDARAVFTVEGAQAHEVLARVCPVDLHADSFAVGAFRRTRMAQVAAAIWRHEAGFDVICFRSVGDYAEGLLRNAAAAAPTGALG